MDVCIAPTAHSFTAETSIMIRILLQSRANLFSKPGGDTTQIVNLKRGLTTRGCHCQISTALKPDLSGYDIVHLFNITRVHETYIQMTRAKTHGIPVICTTIYHDLEEYNRKGRQGLGRFAFRLAGNDVRFEHLRGLFNILRNKNQIIPVMEQWKTGYRNQQESVLRSADKIVFGSESEKQLVFARFKEIQKQISHKTIMVHNPIAEQAPDPVPFQRKFGLENFILCVGRVEDLKNQLSLISAMEKEDVPVVLIGSLNRAHRSYCRNILKHVEKKKNLHYLGPMNNFMLRSAYAAAKVHVLPSWFETVGLTSLEAGAAGCNVVSTNRGYAKDYLKDYAWYCDPSCGSSIKAAVLEAYHNPRKLGLREHMFRKNCHDEMTNATINMYQVVLS